MNRVILYVHHGSIGVFRASHDDKTRQDLAGFFVCEAGQVQADDTSRMMSLASSATPNLASFATSYIVGLSSEEVRNLARTTISRRCRCIVVVVLAGSIVVVPTVNSPTVTVTDISKVDATSRASADFKEPSASPLCWRTVGRRCVREPRTELEVKTDGNQWSVVSTIAPLLAKMTEAHEILTGTVHHSGLGDGRAQRTV